MTNLEETKTRLAYEVAIYKEQLNMLRKEMEKISLTNIDLTNASKTVKNLKENEVMVPVGGGAFIKGNITESKVVVPIGAEYLMEMDKEESDTEITRRIEATKKAVEKLNGEFKKISIKLKEISIKLREVEAQSKISKRVEESAQDDYI